MFIVSHLNFTRIGYTRPCLRSPLGGSKHISAYAGLGFTINRVKHALWASLV